MKFQVSSLLYSMGYGADTKSDAQMKYEQEAQEGLYRSTGLYSFMAANTELSTLTVQVKLLI